MRTAFESNPKERILSHMIRLGVSTPREISSKTGIAKNKVYGFLKDLMAEDLVYVAHRLGRRTETMYSIRENQVSKLLSERQKELQNRITECKALLSEVKESRKRIPFEIQPEILSGPIKDAEQITIEMMMNARKSIMISTYVFSYFGRVKEVLLDAAKRAIDVQVLMTSPLSQKLFGYEHRLLIEDISKILRRAGIKVHYCRERIPFRGTIVDERALIMMTFPFLNKSYGQTTEGYVLCCNQAIVQSLAGYLELVASRDKAQYSR